MGCQNLHCVGFGVSFERTAEGYAYKFIDFAWSAESQSEYSKNQLLKVQTRIRNPIRRLNFIETSDNWRINEALAFIKYRFSVEVLLSERHFLSYFLIK